MPLVDHTDPTVIKHCRWEGFHSQWTGKIVDELNLAVLPTRFHAEPRTRLGGGLEIDAGTLEREGLLIHGPDHGNGIATAVWAPPKPTLEVSAHFSDQDLFEVCLVDETDSRLVAAIELVSPGNKGRPESRRAFVVKCGSYLQSGVSVVIVDVVAERRANFHAELLQLLDVTQPEPWSSQTGMSAVAYRSIPRRPGVTRTSHLQAWLEPLTLGAPLPTLPLWLTEDFVVPLDLEKTYVSACKSFHITS